MPTAGPWATKSYVNFLAGLHGGLGDVGNTVHRVRHLDAVEVDGRGLRTSSLSSTTSTWSPGCTLIVGPGTVPVYVHASTVLPGGRLPRE